MVTRESVSQSVSGLIGNCCAFCRRYFNKNLQRGSFVQGPVVTEGEEAGSPPWVLPRFRDHRASPSGQIEGRPHSLSCHHVVQISVHTCSIQISCHWVGAAHKLWTHSRSTLRNPPQRVCPEPHPGSAGLWRLPPPGSLQRFL